MAMMTGMDNGLMVRIDNIVYLGGNILSHQSCDKRFKNTVFGGRHC